MKTPTINIDKETLQVDVASWFEFQEIYQFTDNLIQTGKLSLVFGSNRILLLVGSPESSKQNFKDLSFVDKTNNDLINKCRHQYTPLPRT